MRKPRRRAKRRVKQNQDLSSSSNDSIEDKIHKSRDYIFCSKATFFLVLTILISLSMAVSYFSYILLPKNTIIMPDDSLREFIYRINQTIPSDLQEKVNELPIDKFTMYVKASCKSGQDLRTLKSMMAQTMNVVPKIVREMVLERALLDGISNYMDIERNTGIDTSGDKVNTASAFYAFFHTKKIENDMYRSCILISGIDLKMDEQIYDWEERDEENTVYLEECTETTGNVFKEKTCKKVPKIKKHTARFPIIKKAWLSQKESEILFYYIVKNAVDNVNDLISDSKYLFSSKNIEIQRIRIPIWHEGFPKPRVSLS